MKKKAWFLLLVFLLLPGLLSGCTGGVKNTEETAAPATLAPAEPEAATGELEAGKDTVRVGSLSGPTSMGLVYLMRQAESGDAGLDYRFTLATTADEITAGLLKGELDIALIPANLASVLYHKTQGQIVAIDINTLGVLYLLESGEAVEEVGDLAGKTIYLPGKGTTPDYALQYVLAQNGLTAEDVDLQYKSEAAEVISALSEDPGAVGLLPQPAAATACARDEALRIALDLTEQWNLVTEGGSLVTGVTVASRSFLEGHEAAVREFLTAHQVSAAFTNEHAAEAAGLIEALGIVPSAAIAEAAIPYCSITCVTGERMQTLLSGYLEVLLGQNAASVGDALPDTDFYYLP